MHLEFEKWQACQNDFMMVSCRAHSQAHLQDALTRAAPSLCRRDGSGIGADGILIWSASTTATASYDVCVINADGSLANTCGNGLRCVGAAIEKSGRSEVADVAGRQSPECLLQVGHRSYVYRSNGSGRGGSLDFGLIESAEPAQPFLVAAVEAALPQVRPVTIDAVTIGNRHLAIRCDLSCTPEQLRQALRSPDLPPVLREWNLHLYQVVAEDTVSFVSYESGVGPTRSCGSGACAVAWSSLERDFCADRETRQLESPGGRLQVDLTQIAEQWAVVLSGPAEYVFRGTVLI